MSAAVTAGTSAVGVGSSPAAATGTTEGAPAVANDPAVVPTMPHAANLVAAPKVTLLAECHYNLALLEHERKDYASAVDNYARAIEVYESEGKGLFVDAKYNLKIAENQLKVSAKAAKDKARIEALVKRGEKKLRGGAGAPTGSNAIPGDDSADSDDASESDGSSDGLKGVFDSDDDDWWGFVCW